MASRKLRCFVGTLHPLRMYVCMYVCMYICMYVRTLGARLVQN